MKYNQIILMLIIIVSCKNENENQAYNFEKKIIKVDTSFIKNTKVDSLIIGFSTLADFKKQGYIFNETSLDKLDDLIVEYNRQGNRFYTDINGKIIIGTYEDSEIVSEIWLQKKFKGKLLGKEINLNEYTVEKMTIDFPNFEWSTNGFAKYWFYKSNINLDTTVFFLNVDDRINQFPFNLKHYLNTEISGVKVEMSPWKIYGPKYGKLDTVYIKPLYSPLLETHSNYYLQRRKKGINTTFREITTFGKKSNYEQIKIGKWLVYNSNHKLESIEYYNNGKMTKIELQ